MLLRAAHRRTAALFPRSALQLFHSAPALTSRGGALLPLSSLQWTEGTHGTHGTHRRGGGAVATTFRSRLASVTSPTARSARRSASTLATTLHEDDGGDTSPFRVLYGSQTGTAHEFSMLLAETLSEDLELEADVEDLYVP